LGDTDKGYPTKDYYWGNVPKNVYDIWKTGADRCKTTENANTTPWLKTTKASGGKHGRSAQRWQRGDSPSLGATWWYTVSRHLWGKAI